MVNFQNWYIHRLFNEANKIIAQANQYIYTLFKEEKGVIELPANSKKKTKVEALSILR